jgi:hypothetical protein
MRSDPYADSRRRLEEFGQPLVVQEVELAQDGIRSVIDF